MISSFEPLEVDCIAKVRPIGVLIIEDESGEDPKILSVPIGDLRFDGVDDISHVQPHLLREIQEFFETYKRLEPHKWPKFRTWKNAQEAIELVAYAINLYKKTVAESP